MATYKDVLMLVDKVSAPLKDIQKNTDKTNKKIDTMRDKLGRVGNNMQAFGSKIAAFGKRAIGVFTAVAAAIAAIGGVVIRTANKYAEMGDRIDKMSQKIGMSRKAFQEWDYIMSQNGGNVETLQMGFKTLVTQIDAVRKGSKDSIKTFNKLGISLKDNNGNLRSADDIFNDTVRALQKMKNPTEKMILANRLFGRSASELRPLLNQSAESIDNLREKANKMGLIISDEDIKNAVEYKDTMDTLKRFFDAKFGSNMMKLMPDIQKGMENIMNTAGMEQNQGVFDSANTSIKWVINTGVPALIEGIMNIGVSLRWIADRIADVAEYFNYLKDSLFFGIDYLIRQFSKKIIQIKMQFQSLGGVVQQIFSTVFNNINAWLNGIIEKLTWLIGKIPGLNKLLNSTNSVRQTQTNNNTTNNTSITNNYGNTVNYGGMFPYQATLTVSPF